MDKLKLLFIFNKTKSVLWYCGVFGRGSPLAETSGSELNKTADSR